MELSEVLNYILYVVLTVILPVVAKYLVNFIKAKINESKVIAEATKSEEAQTLVKNALSNVMDAVLYVNQTYTDSLKANGNFDKKAQKEAFNRAYVKAVELISQGTKDVIAELYGSFSKWLELKIESSVNIAKK